MINIKFKKINENAIIPYKGSKNAACFDLVATEVLIQGNLVTVSFGFSTEIPKGYKAVIVPRSSLTGTDWIMQNSPGQIDSDYRGTWFVKFKNISFSKHEFPYQEGNRVAQCYFEQVIEAEFIEEKELEMTERNDGGFGSTGK